MPSDEERGSYNVVAAEDERTEEAAGAVQHDDTNTAHQPHYYALSLRRNKQLLALIAVGLVGFLVGRIGQQGTSWLTSFFSATPRVGILTADITVCPPSNLSSADYLSTTATVAPTTHTNNNYTISPFHAARWPVPESTMRGVVVSLWAGASDTLRQQFVDRWPGRERYFFQPISAHADHIIFYSIWPVNAYPILRATVLSLDWQPASCADRTIVPFIRQRSGGQFSLQSEGEEWVTAAGVRVLLYPIMDVPPEWLQYDAGLLHRSDWLHCDGRQWSMEYALYSGAIFNHRILSHPLLAAYDLYIKLDLDVSFHAAFPTSPFTLMARQHCVWMHTEYVLAREDCNADADLAALDWAEQTNHTPASSTSQLFFSSAKHGYFYGNMVGGWLGYLRSAENIELMRHLKENRVYPGYWKQRWGDQPAYSVMLGMWYNLTDGQVEGAEYVQTICDFTAFRRNKTFKHV